VLLHLRRLGRGAADDLVDRRGRRVDPEVGEQPGKGLLRPADEFLVAKEIGVLRPAPPALEQLEPVAAHPRDVLLGGRHRARTEVLAAALLVEREHRAEAVAEVADQEDLTCAREELQRHGRQRARQELLQEVHSALTPILCFRDLVVERLDPAAAEGGQILDGGPLEPALELRFDESSCTAELLLSEPPVHRHLVPADERLQVARRPRQDLQHLAPVARDTRLVLEGTIRDDRPMLAEQPREPGRARPPERRHEQRLDAAMLLQELPPPQADLADAHALAVLERRLDDELRLFGRREQADLSAEAARLRARRSGKGGRDVGPREVDGHPREQLAAIEHFDAADRRLAADGPAGDRQHVRLGGAPDRWLVDARPEQPLLPWLMGDVQYLETRHDYWESSIGTRIRSRSFVCRQFA